MAKVKLDIIGKDKGGSAAVKGITGSIISAQLAVEGIKIAFTKLVEIGKKSIESLRTQEQAEAKLEAVTKQNISGFKEFAAEMQSLTTIGDEAILQVQTLGAQMGIQNEQLNEASKGAIGLSKAFGIDLASSMKMVALANEGEFNMLARYIPALRSATTEAEKNAIVQEAMAKGFDAAKAEAETFTGRLEQLKNIQGDNLEAFGKIVSVVGKDFVNVMVEGATSLNDFLSDSDRVAEIAAGFKVFQEILVEIGKKALPVLKDAVSPLTNAISKLFKKTEDGNKGFEILAAVLQAVNTGIAILGKFIKANIQFWVDFVKTIDSVIQIFKALKDGMLDKKPWSEVAKSATKTLNSVKDMGKNLKDNFSDMITTTINEFKKLPDATKKNALELEKIWNETRKNVKDELDGMVDDVENANKEIEKKTKDTKQKQKTTWQDWANSITGIVTSTMSTIQGAFDQFHSQDLEKVASWQEERLLKTDDWILAEQERLGIREETRTEQLNREINDLRKQAGMTSDINQKMLLDKQIQEKKDALERERILKDAEKKKAKIQKQAQKEETALKKEQFEQNKALSIANIWINAAASIMGWYASFASMGIPGIVLATIMTAATLATAGIQTGLVQSQAFHGEQGGVIPTGQATGDNTLLFANKGEALLRSEDYQSLIDMAKGETGGQMYIENLHVTANSPQELSEQLIEIQRAERGR
jgi:hypothetical protein